MRRVVKSTAYADDLFDVWRYIARDNPTAADRLINRVELKLLSLARRPTAGTVCSFATDLRWYFIGKYVLFFRVSAEKLEAVRLIHGARDLESLLTAN